MAKELNRSNSDLTAIDLITNNTALSPIERMHLISVVVADWERAVGDMPAVHGARRTMSTRNHLGGKRAV